MTVAAQPKLMNAVHEMVIVLPVRTVPVYLMVILLKIIAVPVMMMLPMIVFRIVLVIGEVMPMIRVVDVESIMNCHLMVVMMSVVLL